MKTAVVALNLSFFLLATSAPASSSAVLNVDFGQHGHAPATAYAAAGQAGVWNAVAGLTTTPRGGLVDGIGQTPPWLASVTLSADQGMVDVVPHSQPFSNADATLLGDYIVSPQNQAEVYVEGLPEGDYTVLVYLIGRQDFPTSTEVSVTAATSTPESVSVAGTWGDVYVENRSHARFDVTVGADRSLTIALDDGSDAFINGFQLLVRDPAESDLSPFLDERGWEWMIEGYGWSWPVTAIDANGGVGIESLDRYQNASLAVTVPGPAHLRFWWLAEIPRDCRVTLRIDGSDYATIWGDNQLDDPFQVFLPNEENRVVWKVRHLTSSDSTGEDFRFTLDAVEIVGGPNNQPPTFDDTDFRFVAGVDSDAWLNATDPDGDTPLLEISSDYSDPDDYDPRGLPPGIQFTKRWTGRGLLQSRTAILDSVGLYPLYVNLRDGGGEVQRESSLEIASPFAPGIAHHAERVQIDSAFGAAAASADLVAFEDGHAWFLDPATSILLEYTPTGDGTWDLRSTVDSTRLDPGYAFGPALSVDGERLSVLVVPPTGGTQRIHLYVRTPQDAWALDAKLDLPGEYEKNWHPNLALQDAWLAATNPAFAKGDGESPGALFLYRDTGPGSWSLEQSFPAPGVSNYGHPLDMEDGLLALGTVRDRSVAVFRLGSGGIWTEIGALRPGTPASFYNLFGRNLLIAGQQLFVADSWEDPVGVVRIYDLPSLGLPTLRQTLTETTADNFGSALALHGQCLVVGDSYSDLNGSVAGAAYLYAKDSSGLWQLEAVTHSADPVFYEAFGTKLFTAPDALYVANSGSRLHRFGFQTFPEWYEATYGEPIHTLSDAFAADGNENGAPDALDFLSLDPGSHNLSPLPETVQVGSESYRAFRLEPPTGALGIPWQVEHSADLSSWSTEDLRLIDAGPPQIWGLPDHLTDRQAFFRVRLALPSSHRFPR